MVKSYRWVVGGPCDFGVSPSPFDLDFGTLDFGTSDSGLTIGERREVRKHFEMSVSMVSRLNQDRLYIFYRGDVILLTLKD